MADIIEKIGKYFADQEAQMREMYVHAAAQAAAPSAPAKGATSAAPQPPPRGETTAGKPRYRSRARDTLSEGCVNTETTATSLLRRRLSLTKPTAGTATRAEPAVGRSGADKATWWSEASSERENPPVAMSDAASEDVSSLASWQEAASASTRSGEVSSTSLKSKKVGTVKKKKKKQKSSKTTKDNEAVEREKAQQRAAEGLARAQERARRIQMEKAMEEKQQQLEREANAARLAEEMRKIEEIRRKGKQFAMRLRPQSAPTTPQSRTPQQQQQQCEDGPTSAQSEHVDHAAIPVEQIPARKFLDVMEHQMRNQMLDEMKLNETIDDIRSREEEEWTHLQAQIRKTTDRNAIKQERVHALMRSKHDLQKEISDDQAEAVALRQQRHQLEEKSKRERQLKQREAEREIHARLRREESQRLVDEERLQRDHAAEARAKAKMRVHSRAALLKRVLHGCDIRSHTTASPNQDDEDTVQGRAQLKTPIAIEAVPELAEFEEDGLTGDRSGELPTRINPPVSPKKTIRPAILQANNPIESSFEWRVPALPMREIHSILHEAFNDLFESA